eukprot:jgi/Psemu1/25800/gm1.25800_g
MRQECHVVDIPAVETDNTTSSSGRRWSLELFDDDSQYKAVKDAMKRRVKACLKQQGPIGFSEIFCQQHQSSPSTPNSLPEIIYLKLDWPSNVSKTDIVFQKVLMSLWVQFQQEKTRIFQEVNLNHFANESFVHDHLYKKLLPNLYQCSFVVGWYKIAGVDNLLVEHRKTLNGCYKVVMDFKKNLVTLCTLKLSTERDAFVANLGPEHEQHMKTLLQNFILTLCWGDNVLLTPKDDGTGHVELLNILCNKLLNNVLTTWLSRHCNGIRVLVNWSMVVKTIVNAVLDKEEETTLNLDTAVQKMDGYLKAEHQSLSNFNPGGLYCKDRLYIYTTDGNNKHLLVTRFLNFDENCQYTLGNRLFWDHTRFHKERKVSPNLGHVVNLGYLWQVPCPSVTKQSSGNVKVLFLDLDPPIKYPCFALDSKVTTTGFDALCAQNRHLVLIILNRCNKINDYITKEVFPNYEEGDTDDIDHVWAMGIILAYVLCSYPALKGTEDIKCYSNMGIGPEYGYSMDNIGFYSTEERFPVMGDHYKEHMDEVHQREDLNPFFYNFETGYDPVCNRNGHFVLTILDRCKLTNIVRTTLNSRKGRFEEAKADAIWIEALDYVHYKLFLDHDKGNTYTTNHIWGMGIILSYILCDYPALNGKADIHCYDTIGIGPKADSQQQSKMEMDEHSFPAKPWCQLTQPLTDWWIITTLYVIVKEGLKNAISKIPTEEYTTNIEHADEVKVMHKDRERKCMKEQWDSFMNKARKQSKTKKQKLKELTNKENKEEEDRNERNI